ncbi:unnamed protein product [Kuraishia capsulata CBS 1993]|uniref:Uncharacterized protein n=1 Tax=Kuraishia capsulata CBS 1993 TaxID=1382522 RepID=W6MSM2_9ASCO|nr:uncharacterized protein KUCA_T00005697001 [Kuraishia capsulata CBS 1993]CDK29704.1 unnamed protein product [Kuraishia capsulata CBS 1993]
MVLHNNKWDRKAKRNYVRKHGLGTEGSGEQPVEDPEEVGSDVVEFDSNSWRYRKPKKEADGDKPDNTVELDNSQDSQVEEKNSDQSDDDQMSDIDDDIRKLVIDSLAQKDAAVFEANPRRLSISDYLEWSEEKVGTTPQLKNRILTEDEKQEFYELERKIEEQRFHNDVRAKFSVKQKEFKAPRKPKVMDLSRQGDDNYRTVVDQKLDKASVWTTKATQKQLDDDLEELLGTPLETSTSSRVDLDDLLNLKPPDKLKVQPHARDVTAPKPGVEKDDNDEFLDELLGD